MLRLIPALLSLSLVVMPQLPSPQGANAPNLRFAQQEMGGWCQTPFGGCPLLDSNGQPTKLPVGTLCFCGRDSGQVVF